MIFENYLKKMRSKSYFITDPSICGNTPETLKSSLTKIIKQHNPDFICLRDKTTLEYENLAKTFLHVETNSKKLLHGNIDLAIKLGFFGVHLTSLQFDEIKKAKENGLYVIVSTHSLEEALKAKEADAITYSPIFHSPNKGIPKGLADLKDINGKIKTKIFALGGITSKQQIKQIETTGVYGFASIRYFKDL